MQGSAPPSRPLAVPGRAWWLTSPILRRWRLVALPGFVVLLLGFTLVPDSYPALRVPLILLAAVFAGLTGEMMAPTQPPGVVRSLWVVPAGMVAILISWLADVPERPGALAVAATLAVLAISALQSGEWSEVRQLRATTHAISIGLAYAVAFRVFYLATGLPVPAGAALSVAASAAVALVVLRGPAVPPRMHLALAAVSALVAGELMWVLLASPALPLACAILGLLGLYAVSTACHALVDRAPPRAYLEVLTVAVTAFLIVTLALVRR